MYVNGFWSEDCTFMAVVGSGSGKSLSPSNPYTGYLDKSTGQLVFEYLNYEGVNRYLWLGLYGSDGNAIPVDGTMNVRLDYFGTIDADLCPSDV